jgi:GNAT superfamily N-acetyltransferase
MIRVAVPSDKLRVLMLARAFHSAAGLPFPFSAAHADAIFRASLEQEDRLCLVLDVDGVAQGVLVAEAGPHPFGPFKMATEHMWWIEPAYRGRAARQMIADYEAWAKGRGCLFAHLTGLGEDPAAGRLYQRSGYSAAERHFMKLL